MKCPNCGATNGKTNKYCRECGTRLDVLVSRELQHDADAPRADEVGLGADLFNVLELIESSDLDAALEKAEKLASDNPGSASAHSVIALIYERNAEREHAEGNEERSHEFLKLAVEHYEAIIDLNPDSAADREKLITLRMRYTGHAAPVSKPKPPVSLDFAAALKSIPKPALAAFGTFLVVLMLVIVFTKPPRSRPAKPEPATATSSQTVSLAQAPIAEPALKVYTFPQAPAQSPTPPPTVSIPTPRAPSSEIELKPMKLPKIDRELTLVPEPKSTSKKPAVEPAKQVGAEKPAAVASGPGGGTLLAQAIRLHDQGKDSEAIGAANSAIVLYNADIDAGRNVDSARRGAANATKLITLWEQNTTEQQ